MVIWGCFVGVLCLERVIYIFAERLVREFEATGEEVVV